MKSGVLASKLDEDGSPVSKDSIMAAIRKLNKLCKKQFGTDARVVSLRSADTTTHPKWGDHVPVCQNSSLCLGAAGQSLKAFVIDKEETNTMQQDQVDFFQGVIASYMNLEQWKDGLNKNQRKKVRKLIGLRDKSGLVQEALEDGGVHFEG